MSEFDNDSYVLVESECGKYIEKIDKVTGKVVHRKRVLQYDEKIISKKQSEGLKEMMDKAEFLANLTSKDKFWIASKHENVKNVISAISGTEATDYAKMLSKITLKSDGFLVNDRGAKMTFTDIMDLFKKAERRTAQEINRFKKLKMLNVVPWEKDGRVKHYQIAKEFHSMGSQVNEKFTQIYLEKLKELVHNDSLGNALGTFYKMLPYIHFQTYYLVWNPDVNIHLDKEKSLFENLEMPKVQTLLQHVTISDFAQVIGITPKTFIDHLDRLEQLHVINKNVQGESALIMVHPSFVSRKYYKNKEQKYMESMVNFQFSQHKSKKTKRGKKDSLGKQILKERKETVKQLLSENPTITNIEIAQILGVHRNTVTKIRKNIENENAQ